jgi:SAM-dependent methyltransferase
MMVDARLIEFYETLFSEEDRLTRREGQLELIRTQELLEQFLPDPPAHILDVGVGTGLYAAWLAERGYEVQLIDVVPSHVAAAAAIGTFAACVGDARALPEPNASYDVVLFLGPLYHLRTPHDRGVALREAMRVLRPGGLFVGAFISRAALALDGFVKSWIWEGERLSNMLSTVTKGYVEADRGVGFGKISYFHLPSDALLELKAAGLDQVSLLGVEGPGWIAPNFEEQWSRPLARDLIIRIARACEADPVHQILSPHLLAFAHRPEGPPESL